MRSPPSSSLSRTWSGLAGSILALALSGCAGSHKPPPRRIAIMPVDLLGMPAEQGQALQRALETEVTKQPHNQLTDPQTIRAALPTDDRRRSACLDDEACLLAVGQKLAVDLVLSLRMAGLGDTHVIRARLFDVPRGILIQDFQETGGSERALPDHARALSRRLFPPPAKKSRWWLWTLGAAAIAATATALLIAEDQTGIIHLGDL